MPEIELKLALDETQDSNIDLTQIDIIKNHLKSQDEQELISIYFDTADLSLRQNGFALRTRLMPDGRWIQTVKGKGQAINGLHSREEIDLEIFSENPVVYSEEFINQCTENQQAVLHNLQILINFNPISPIFTTAFHRKIYWLEFENGDAVEVAFDIGKITLGSKFKTIIEESDSFQVEPVDSIREIELELKAGNAQRLFELGFDLSSQIGLKLSNISKAERGYDLYRPKGQLKPVKSQKLVLAYDNTVEDVFIQFVNASLKHLQLNQVGVVKHCFENPEFLHQARVALRRLRSVFDVFKSILPKNSLKDILTEVKILNNAFGPARDWDVLMSETLQQSFATLHDHPELPQLKATLEEVHQRYVTNAQQIIDSKHYHRLLLLIQKWLMSKPWREHNLEAWDSYAFDFSKKILQKKHNAVYKLGRNLKHISDEQRHEFRILCKKLRYTTEFFSSYYHQECEIISSHQVECTHRYLTHLEKLQDVLGLLNDGIVAQTTLKDIQPPLITMLQREMLDYCLEQMNNNHLILMKNLFEEWNNFVECEWYWNPKSEESKENHKKRKKIKKERQSKEELKKLKRRKKEIKKLYK